MVPRKSFMAFVRIERVEVVLDALVVEDVTYQLGLAHPPRGGEQDVALVPEMLDDGFRFLLAVAEILIGDDSG